MAIENIVDDISWFQGALQNGNVPLWVEEFQNILPVKGEHVLIKNYVKCEPCRDNCGVLITPYQAGEGFVEGPVV